MVENDNNNRKVKIEQVGGNQMPSPTPRTNDRISKLFQKFDDKMLDLKQHISSDSESYSELIQAGTKKKDSRESEP